MSNDGFIPLSVPDLRGREIEYLRRCVEDNWVSSAGPFVTELENRLAAYVRQAHAVAAVNGTAALHLALLSGGIRPGDQVVLPDWTFAATANAVLHAGAVPVFVDIDPESWCLDAGMLAELLAAKRIAPKAVIAVDVLGHPADWDTIRAAVAGHDILLIEDAAGALGARYKGRPAGGLADIGTISFNGNKVITAGGGGMLLSDSAPILARARHLSTQARPGEEYEHDAVGFNYRMTNVNAAIGLAQFERLDEMVAARRGIAARYDAAFSTREDVGLMPRLAWAESSCWLYSVAFADAALADRVVRRLAARKIGARRFWRSLSRQAPYSGAERFARGVADDLSGRVVSLPCSSFLASDEQTRVIEDVLAALP